MLQNQLYPWYAVQVRARSEKLVGQILQNKGFEHLLPLYSVIRKRSDRVVGVQLPLFPGYLFCRLDLNSRLLPLFTTPGVMRLVGVGQTPSPVDDSEIDAIRAVLKAGRTTRPWPMPKTGERVRIEAGPLCGVEGILIGQKKNSRLVVSVSLLQRAVAVEVDADMTRPVVSKLRFLFDRPAKAPRSSEVAFSGQQSAISLDCGGLDER